MPKKSPKLKPPKPAPPEKPVGDPKKPMPPDAVRRMMDFYRDNREIERMVWRSIYG